jgi:hypothetical protein
MAEGGILAFTDPDGYAAAFSGARVNLTINGAGEFKARLTRLKLRHLEIYRYYESLPRIAYIFRCPPSRYFCHSLSAPSLSYSMDLLCETATWSCTVAASAGINDCAVSANGA